MQTNRLVNSLSPYLLQHADNPVEWYEWGEEAFAQARLTGKPIFVSIGYSTCHWCHVMAHECFENPEIAALQNKTCINIKIDREERPDLDEVYMTATQILTGQGGWPMSVFLDHDLVPFYAGTYFPPSPRYGRISFPMLLERINEVWNQKRSDLHQQGQRILTDMQQWGDLKTNDQIPSSDWLSTSVNRIKNGFDPVDGGFSGAPKFPDSQSILLLLNHSVLNKDAEAQSMAHFTLQQMSMGGIYDALGGGFARYSVDERWFVPHFEKMLYDNAMLPRAYQTAALITGHADHARVALETCQNILREFLDESGGFHSAQDADSEGVEGKYYVWSLSEIKAILGEQPAHTLAEIFNLSEHGNWEEGNIFYQTRPWQEWLIKNPTLKTLWPQWREQLYQQRIKRIHPGQDDKILTEWNGLMIYTLAFVGRHQHNQEFINAALRAAEMIWQKMYSVSEQQLLRCYRKDKVHTPAFAADYAALAEGYLALWETTGNLLWLERSELLIQNLNEHFWDNENGAYFYTSQLHKHLLKRSKHPFDNPYPGPNTMAANALQQLYRWTGKQQYLEKFERVLCAYEGLFQKQTWGLSGMLGQLFNYYAPQSEIYVFYPQEQAAESKLLQLTYHIYVPNQLSVGISKAQALQYLDSPKAHLSPTLLEKIKSWISEGAKQETAFVCRNQTCSLPITQIEELKKATTVL